MRSRPSRRRRSTTRRGSSASRRRSPIRRASGCRRNGRSARSARRRRRVAWERRSPTQDATPCSPWSASPARTISTRPISMGKSTPPPISLPTSAPKLGVAAQTQPARALDERPPATSAMSAASAASATSPTMAFARKEKAVRPARTMLGPEQSAAVREQLLADIGQLQSPDEAADWVHKNLSLKNTLTAADADLVEAGFRERLAAIESASTTGEEQSQSAPKQVSAPSGEEPFLASMGDATAAPMILPRAATVRRRPVAAKTIRLRDKEHCKFVATQPCVVCGRTPTEAHHIRFAQPRALGRKVSDEYTVPVCRLHHRELHGYGDEASWWAGVSIDPAADRARAMAAVEIAVLIGSGLVRALVRCPRLQRRRSIGRHWTTTPGTGSSNAGKFCWWSRFSADAHRASFVSRAGTLQIAPYRSQFKPKSLVGAGAPHHLHFGAIEHSETPPP